MTARITCEVPDELARKFKAAIALDPQYRSITAFIRQAIKDYLAPRTWPTAPGPETKTLREPQLPTAIITTAELREEALAVLDATDTAS